MPLGLIRALRKDLQAFRFRERRVSMKMSQASKATHSAERASERASSLDRVSPDTSLRSETPPPGAPWDDESGGAARSKGGTSGCASSIN